MFVNFASFLLDVELGDLGEYGLRERPEVHDCCVHKDGWVILHDFFEVRLVRFNAQHDFEIVLQVIFVDFVELSRFEGLLLGFLGADVVYDFHAFVFGVVERQVSVVEEVVDVVGDFVVVEGAFGQGDALAFELAVVAVRATVHDDFLKPVLELELLLVGLEPFDFEFTFADELAREPGREGGAVAFVANHDNLAAVLEQSTHSVAEIPEGVVYQDEVDGAAAAVSVEVFQFANQVLAEGVVEFLGAVGVLVDVDLLLEHEDWLHC